jgi:uncharacterized protein YkwD
VLLALMLAGSTTAGASKTMRQLEQSFVHAINDVRADHGRPPVRVDARLRSVARAHTLDMLERRYFAHGDFARRVASAGAPGSRVGENLGWVEAGETPVKTLVSLWMRSATHRAVILRPGFDLIGVGVAEGPFKGHPSTFVVTADFSGE